MSTPQGGFLKSRIFSENRLFTLKTLFLPSGAGKSVFRKKCFFDLTQTYKPTNKRIYFFRMTLPSVEGITSEKYYVRSKYKTLANFSYPEKINDDIKFYCIAFDLILLKTFL